MDINFLKFCYLIIAFFTSKSPQNTAQELISCINCEMLLRDSNEIIYRVLLREAEARRLNLVDYLTFIAKNLAVSPEEVIVVSSSDLD